MKKNFFKLASLATAACFACALTFVFQSCNSDADELVQNESVEKDVKTAFRNDLRVFTIKQKLLSSPFKLGWNGESGSYETTRSGGISKEDYYAKMEENLRPIFENYDLTSDLTPRERQGMNLSQEQKEILTLDPEAYRDYIQEYKSEAFCKVYDEFAADPTNTKVLEQALENPDLKMNEMLHMAIVASTLDTALDDENAFHEYKKMPETVEGCIDEYSANKKLCARDYLVGSGLSVLGGSIFSIGWTIAGIAWATKVYYECEEHAYSDFRRCKDYVRR